MASLLGGYWTVMGASPELVFKFDFGAGPVQPGYLQVLSTTAFNTSLGYGFADVTKVASRDRGGSNALIRDFCLPNGTPFLVDLPNGEYSVTVISGDQIAPSTVAVDVEGRTMLSLSASTGQFGQGTFVVNVTNGQLALNFVGSVPRVNSLEISRILKYDFGPGVTATGYTNVLQTTAYSPETGYGFVDITKVASRDRGTGDPLLSDFCLPNGTPFRIDLPNGQYTVSLSTGDQIGSTRMGISANGLPQFYSFGSSAGRYLTDSFPIVVSNGRLDVEGTGTTSPHFNAMTVTRIADDLLNQPVTVFVIGDSTVSDYNQYFFPQAGWGQMLGSFFDRNVVVDNLAERGASSKSYYNEGWLNTILNRIKPNDYLFIQWGINDRAADEGRHTDPFTTFEDYLALYVDAARQHGAIPVLITSQNRRSFNASGVSVNGYGNFPEATRRLAAKLAVPLIDLNAKSLALFTQYGVEGSKSLFLWLPAGQYPNFPNGSQDDVHFQELGAQELARLVVEGIVELNLQPLSLHLR
ncbi:MAG TPA: GDSL-type esterase/lipase family protein [Blastocatellia bacterium]|nr:GDSL-type esterase/lipase family protein [Blastocatellia bacterium]